MKLPPDHTALLRQHDFTVPADAGIGEAEVRLLQKYGRWMEALSAGRIEALTPEQERFLAVCRGLEQPASEFERAWSAYTKWQSRPAEPEPTGPGPMEVADRLEQLSDARRYAASLRAECERLREEILAQVRDQLAQLETEFAEQQGEADEQVQRLEAEVRRAVLELGQTATHANIQAVYVAKRVTWDGPGLSRYAESNPEVLEFRKVGGPSVRLQYRDKD